MADTIYAELASPIKAKPVWINKETRDHIDHEEGTNTSHVQPLGQTFGKVNEEDIMGATTDGWVKNPHIRDDVNAQTFTLKPTRQDSSRDDATVIKYGIDQIGIESTSNLHSNFDLAEHIKEMNIEEE